MELPHNTHIARPAELCRLVMDFAHETEDGDPKYIAIRGAFTENMLDIQPAQAYDRSSWVQIGDVMYEADKINAPLLDAIYDASPMFYGTLFFPREHLADDVLETADNQDPSFPQLDSE